MSTLLKRFFARSGVLPSVLASALASVLTFGPGFAQPAAAMDEGRIHIVLRAHVQAEQAMVNFGDVAAVAGEDPEMVNRIIMLPLGATPLPGKRVRLLSVHLQDWLRRSLGASARSLRWSGASQVLIVGSAPAVTRGSVALLAWRSGAIRLETRVEVLQDGRLGDQVYVRRLAGSSAGGADKSQAVGETMMARVIKPGHVAGLEP